MNDRYKFKVWDVRNKCFFSPTHLAYKGQLRDLTINLNGSLAMRNIGGSVHESCFDEMGEGPFILLQSTGLRDKTRTEEHPKGRLGFEGDIVKKIYKEYPMFVDGWGKDLKLTRENAEAILKAPEYTLRTDIYIIDFDRGEFYLKRHPTYGRFGIYQLDNSEIIGNIYEDPELLNESKAEKKSPEGS